MDFKDSALVYNTPTTCSKCGGALYFAGVGEYKCEKCRNVEYDDYGKVRCYIEQHHGANAAEIEAAVGVKQKAIRQMIKDSKLEVAANSKSFLRCELCGTNIRSGRYCSTCETIKQRSEETANKKKNKAQGFGVSTGGESGAKRFKRE